MCKHCRKGLQHVIPSGDSYLAAVSETTELRDASLQGLKAVDFKHEGKVIPLVIHRFGDISAGKVTSWIVTGSYGDTTSDFGVGIRNKFRARSHKQGVL